jgi:acyl-CoA synthetase (AMP-forming)/AMP-acid ligase II
MGMGAICHTLNPRLTGSQLGVMAAEGNCRVLVASADLAPLAGQIVAQATQIEQVVIIDGPAEAVKGGRERPVTMALELAMVQARGAPTWGGRVFALGSLLHIRYDGGAEGRDLYPSIELSSYTQAAAGRCLRPHLG